MFFFSCDLIFNLLRNKSKCLILEDNNIKDIKAVLESEIVGLCICTREAVKLMKARDCKGHIININR